MTTTTTGWRTDFAPTIAELNTCVACGLCLPHCPTFRLTGLETASPRGRIAAMRGVTEGVLQIDAVFEDAMTFCLNCRACEAVCPSMVPFGRLMEGARAELAVARPSLQRRLRHFVLGRVLANRGGMGLVTDAVRAVQRLGLHRLLAGTAGRSASGLRSIANAPRRLEQRDGPRVGLLVGCVMDKWFRGVNQAAIDVLALAGCQVVVPPSQTCCGALAVHDGDILDGRRLAATNVEAFLDVDLVVATAAGCSAHLKGYDKIVHNGGGLAARAVDITELVAHLIADGSLPRLEDRGREVVVHDPCHLRHAQRITAAPRDILTAGGYRVVDADPEGICCGAAGIYSLLRPKTALALGQRIAGLVAARGSTLVASANPGCEMQLRSHLPNAYRVAHPVELYLEAIRSGDDHDRE